MYKKLTDRREDACGCKQFFKKTIVTNYVVENNSSRQIDRFYIDHSARSEHGGYVITTKCDNQVKSVMGWSRFSFSIPPQGAINFSVEEEATFSEAMTTQTSLKSFISSSSPNLLEKGALTTDVLELIKAIVQRSELTEVLRKIENMNFTEIEHRKWVESRVPVPEEILLSMKTYMEMLDRLSVISKLIVQHEAHITAVYANQERLRKNLHSMEKLLDSPLVTRYMQDLDKEEDDLLKTRLALKMQEESKDGLQQQIKQLQVEMKDHVARILEGVQGAVIPARQPSRK